MFGNTVDREWVEVESHFAAFLSQCGRDRGWWKKYRDTRVSLAQRRFLDSVSICSEKNQKQNLVEISEYFSLDDQSFSFMVDAVFSISIKVVYAGELCSASDWTREIHFNLNFRIPSRTNKTTKYWELTQNNNLRTVVAQNVPTGLFLTKKYDGSSPTVNLEVESLTPIYMVTLKSTCNVSSISTLWTVQRPWTTFWFGQVLARHIRQQCHLINPFLHRFGKPFFQLVCFNCEILSTCQKLCYISDSSAFLCGVMAPKYGSEGRALWRKN